MKRILSLALAALVLSTACAGEFVPNRNIEFYISSAAGGSSDMFTRTIADICKSEGYVNEPFIINNMPDGKGQIARINVRDSRSPNHALLCFSSGDFAAMVTTAGSDLKIEDFAPLGILAADKHLIFASKDGKYKTMDDLLAGLKNGDTISIAGTKSDELSAFTLFAKEIGYEDSFSYIMYESSSENITAIMGGHNDLSSLGVGDVYEKYVKTGQLKAMSMARNTRSPIAPDVPSFEEATGKRLPEWVGLANRPLMLRGETDPAIIEKLSVAFKAASEDPKFIEEYAKTGYVLRYMSPEQVNQTRRRDVAEEMKAAAAKK